MSRATKAYVSAYQLDRVHVSRVFRYSKRTYSADFSGALEDGERIAACVWRTVDNVCVVFSNDVSVDKEGRRANVTIQAVLSGCAVLKCEVTTNYGRVLNQLYKVVIAYAPWFIDEPVVSAGAYSVSLAPATISASPSTDDTISVPQSATFAPLVTVTLSAANGVPPFTYSVSVPSGIGAVDFTASNAANSIVQINYRGAVDQGASLPLSVTATDAGGNITQQTFTYSVIVGNPV